jgi:predicted AAA+ superfamily ATPase
VNVRQINDLLSRGDVDREDMWPGSPSTMIRDWMLGDVVATGRSRLALGQVLSAIFRFVGTPVGFAKLREAGLANNTVASGYVEQLADLLCVVPQWEWDPGRGRYDFRKPCKLPFVNLAAVTAWHPAALRHVHEFEALDERTRAALAEWLVAQELWRRAAWAGTDPEALGFWRSRDHEIDFVAGREEWIEVKVGRAGPLETERIRGVTLHDFLLEGPARVAS